MNCTLKKKFFILKEFQEIHVATKWKQRKKNRRKYIIAGLLTRR